MKITCR